MEDPTCEDVPVGWSEKAYEMGGSSAGPQKMDRFSESCTNSITAQGVPILALWHFGLDNSVLSLWDV